MADLVLRERPARPSFAFLERRTRITSPVVSPPGPDPVSIITPPSVSSQTVEVGGGVTLIDATYAGAVETSALLTQGGVDRTSEIVDSVWSPAVVGAFIWSVSATGAGGDTVAAEVHGEVVAAAPAGIDYSSALVYFDADTPFTGSAGDVTAIASRGSAALSLDKVGTASIQRTASGFVFADTGYLEAAGIPASAATDGMFLVVDFTQDAVGSNWARLSDGSGSRLRLQINSGNRGITGSGADDTSVNIALGTATLGTRHVVAFEMDDVLNQLTGRNAAGESVGPIAHAGVTDPVNTTINVGQFLRGTIHRWALFGRSEGGAWTHTMDEVYADFLAA